MPLEVPFRESKSEDTVNVRVLKLSACETLYKRRLVEGYYNALTSVLSRRERMS